IISLSGVFSDADGDSLTITASSSAPSIATASVSADYSSITVTAKSEGTATITVTAQDADGNTASDAFDVTVSAPPNNAPTISSAIADVIIVNESGTSQASLSGVFADADNDDLTVTADSSDENVATVSVASDDSTLTVSAKSRGAANITVTASDGKGGEVSDTFAVTVKSAPVVASSIADVSALEVDATHEVSLSGVFSDADGDSLAITAASSDEGKATVSVSADQSTLTVSGVSEGTATITVTAQDADGNTATDTFDVTVNTPVQPEPVESEPQSEQEPQLQQQAAQLPGAVTNLTVEPRNTRIIVSWEAPTDGGSPTGYIAHIKPIDGGDGHTMTPDASKTTIQFRRLNRETEYLIWVRAVNEEGKGERTPIRTSTK
ncbi:MAG: Ig-like domain-containing protein, partial [Chloroflexi bacterium]|nr:Ig-like domain-containing protein [Chloroflexota bacterium]